MAIVRKEWEDRYDELKNMPDVPTTEKIKEEWEGKELQFKARLSEIKDTTSPEYKAIMAERKQAKKQFESQQIAYYSAQKYLDANKTNIKAVKKNFTRIDTLRKKRDIYQDLLDELLEAKAVNKERERKIKQFNKEREQFNKEREQIKKEIENLDVELAELKTQEKDALNAIKNFAKTPEQKEAARNWLEEVRENIKINQNLFAEKNKELNREFKEELNPPLIEVPENDIKELEEQIEICNKKCELLLQGKSVEAFAHELGIGTDSKRTPVVEEAKTSEQKSDPVAVPEPTIETEVTPVENKNEMEEKVNVGSPLGADRQKEATDENTKGVNFRISDLEDFESASIYVNKEGSAMEIETSKDNTSEYLHYTPLITAKGSDLLEKVNPEIVESARKIGDKYVIREILGNTQLGTNQKEELLSAYMQMIQLRRNDSKADISKYSAMLDLHYDLRGIDKIYLTKEEKQTLLQKAREAKKLNIAEVKPGVKVGIQWLWQDIKDVAKGLKFWDKNKAIEAGESPVTIAEEATAESKDSHRAFAEELGNTAYNGKQNNDMLPKPITTKTQSTESKEMSGSITALIEEEEIK